VSSAENTMKDHITIEGHDGTFAAYMARPEALPAPAVVVLQELFGVNADIRNHCDKLCGSVNVCIEVTLEKETSQAQEGPMNADVLTTRVADGVAVIALGSAKPIHFDAEMGDPLTEALDGFAGDARLRSYEEQKITSPSRSIEVETGSANHE